MPGNPDENRTENSCDFLSSFSKLSENLDDCENRSGVSEPEDELSLYGWTVSGAVSTLDYNSSGEQ